jgi:fibro-slime domain-containing protein
MKYSTGRTFAFFGTLGWTLASIACSASSNSTGGSSTGGSSNSGTGGGNAYIVPGAGAGAIDPTKALQDDGTLLLLGTIRDFHPTFADMEPCTNSPPKLCDSGHVEQNPTPSDMTQSCGAGTKYPNSCFVDKAIGSDSKPVYVGPAGGTVTTTGPDHFHSWFNDLDGTNLSAQLPVSLNPNPDGVTWTYSNDAFFPIDSALFGPEGQTDGAGTPRNYGFTTEFHLNFTYKTGQTFYFKGDDDLLVFIAGQLAVDRSGIHNAQDATLNLDTLGLTNGNDYQFDLFYCERHRTLSEITITTSMEFTAPVGIN